MKRANLLLSLGLLAGLAAGTLVYAAVDGPRATLMSERDYESAAKRIDRDTRKSLIQCASLAGYEASVCGTETRTHQSVLMAELTASYLGTVAAAVDARRARAEAALEVENARCEAFQADSRDACRQIALDERHAAVRALAGPA